MSTTLGSLKGNLVFGNIAVLGVSMEAIKRQSEYLEEIAKTKQWHDPHEVDLIVQLAHEHNRTTVHPLSVSFAVARWQVRQGLIGTSSMRGVKHYKKFLPSADTLNTSRTRTLDQ